MKIIDYLSVSGIEENKLNDNYVGYTYVRET